jgi:hypothetical protein
MYRVRSINKHRDLSIREKNFYAGGTGILEVCKSHSGRKREAQIPGNYIPLADADQTTIATVVPTAKFKPNTCG